MPGAADAASIAAGATPAGAIAQTALGAAGFAYNLIKMKQAEKERKQLANSRPKYTAADGGELALAESELGPGGMSAGAENAYGQLENKQFSSSLDAILRGGGSVNNVADVFDTTQEGRLRLTQLNEEMRLRKLNNLIAARRNQTEQTDKEFQFNEWMPWADDAQANAMKLQTASQGMGAAFGAAGAGVTNAASGMQSAGGWDKYWQQSGAKNT